MNESTPDTPIITLKQNRNHAMTWGIGGCIVFFVFSLYHIIAVICTGSLAAGIASDESLVQQIIYFCFSLYFLPFSSLFFINGINNYGTFKFYLERLEFESFWFKRKISIPYEKMRVRITKINAVIIDSDQFTFWPTWKTPLKFLRAARDCILIPAGLCFDDRIIENLRWGDNTYLNPQDGPKAIQILKEKALSVDYI